MIWKKHSFSIVCEITCALLTDAEGWSGGVCIQCKNNQIWYILHSNLVLHVHLNPFLMCTSHHIIIKIFVFIHTSRVFKWHILLKFSRIQYRSHPGCRNSTLCDRSVSSENPLLSSSLMQRYFDDDDDDAGLLII